MRNEFVVDFEFGVFGVYGLFNGVVKVDCVVGKIFEFIEIFWGYNDDMVFVWCDDLEDFVFELGVC